MILTQRWIAATAAWQPLPLHKPSEPPRACKTALAATTARIYASAARWGASTGTRSYREMPEFVGDNYWGVVPQHLEWRASASVREVGRVVPLFLSCMHLYS